MSDTLTTMVRELRILKDTKEGLDAKVKSVNLRIRNLAEQRIPDYMDDHEITKHAVKGVGVVFLTTKVYAYVKADDREKFYEELRKGGNGDLIKETVHPSTLNAFAKEMLSSGKALPETLEARFYPTANLRRS